MIRIRFLNVTIRFLVPYLFTNKSVKRIVITGTSHSEFICRFRWNWNWNGSPTREHFSKMGFQHKNAFSYLSARQQKHILWRPTLSPFDLVRYPELGKNQKRESRKANVSSYYHLLSPPPSQPERRVGRALAQASRRRRTRRERGRGRVEKKRARVCV